ncbi:hypothetical protein AIOL_001274 [Candidatus Rhodobacter oscarellae]|uniref:Uncharacterized protein n=1 Tax=Candidatus Rhodobacter oscarellae TaxID=1675527 RepID=A0A0J9E0X3_9RHOB|nr:hypothetical protein AIOL_001274 [Candidatus Rhodobacter lobularis]
MRGRLNGRARENCKARLLPPQNGESTAIVPYLAVPNLHVTAALA